MAQIIKHRRGSLESLSAVTSSLVKGEIVIATGSSNLSNVTNGQGLTFAAHADGQIKAVNRVLRGNNPNIFSGSIYNGLLDGVPFYASSSKTLYLLGSDTNEAIDLTGNISTFSTSVDSRLDSIETSLGGGGSLGTRVGNLETISASYLDFTQSYYTTSGSFATAISASDAEYTSFSASAAATYAVSSSVASATATSITSLSSSVKAVTDTLAVSSSVASATATSITALSSSIASQKYAQLSASNIFYGTQTITGSVYISADLIVQGSSSLQNITASAVDIGTNTILLNTDSPAVRYGGISVRDSGSNAGTGSLWWDSVNNHWIYEHPADSGAPYNSAILIAGPKNTGSLGEEVGLTSGRIPVATGDDHIDNSIMLQSGSKITLTGDLDVTGNISASTISGIGNVTAFSTSVDSRLDSVEASLGGGGSVGSRVAALETISASYLDFTQSYYTDSASFDTRISSSKAEYTSFSASAVTTLSSLSASIYQTDATQSTNVTNISSSLAGRVNTLETAGYAVSSSVASATANSITSLSSSVKAITDTLAVSSSVATATANSITSLSSSVKAVTDTLAVSSSVASATATSLSTLSASVYQTDATQSSNFTALSSSVFTQFSASNASELALSTSVDSRLDTIESSLGGGSGIGSRVSALETISASYLDFTQSYYTTSGSIATQFSASDARETSFSASIDGRVDKLEASQSAIDGALTLSGQNVTVKGDLIVNGTTTTVNSTTIELGDNIISLRGTTSAFGGIQISDAVNPSTTSGSLLWDLTNDYWIAGKSGSEAKVLVAVGDGVVSSSAQITLSSTTGYSTFSSSVATATANSISTLSGSVKSVTDTLAVSSSVATAISASNANITALSTSVDSRLDTLEGTGTIQGVGTTNNVTFNSVTSSVNLGSAAGSSKRVAFRNTNGNLDLVTAPSTTGDVLQWDGTDFVMSNVIDGGSF